mgnify:FL=1
MEFKIKSRYLKISPRKLRLAVNLIRGMNAKRAHNVLKFQNNKGSTLVANLILSGLSVAKAEEISGDRLIISQIACNDGPSLKRGKPASKGSYLPMKKRQSHLELTLSDDAKPNKSNKSHKSNLIKKESNGTKS